MSSTPTSVADITAEWLADATGWPIDEIGITVIGAGEGFMGQLARVTVTSSQPDVPRSVIVKLPTADPGAQLIGQMMRVWEREYRFYDELAPSMTVRVPTTYVNQLDPPCLVLEDLAPAVPGDHVAGATVAQARAAVDLLARLHGAWFEHPTLRALAWMPGLDDPMMATFRPTFEMGWPMFLDRYATSLPGRCLRWCETFVIGLDAWIETHLDDPVTLTHGDFRLDNIFFAPDGGLALIDWQLAMRVPGQTDLVYFCANNLTAADRRQHEDELLRRYVDALHAAGVPEAAVTLDGVHRAYVEGLLFYASSFGASLLTLDPGNERGATLFDALVRRTFTAVDDLDAGIVVGID
jgi:hypothetical protein